MRMAKPWEQLYTERHRYPRQELEEKKDDKIKQLEEENKSLKNNLEVVRMHRDWLEKENKSLKDDNFQKERKLKNAEDRYLKLLWEYTDLRIKVKQIWRVIKQEVKNLNFELDDFYSIIWLKWDEDSDSI